MIVNTFFEVFLYFFRKTLGQVGKKDIVITRFMSIKNSSKNPKKLAIFLSKNIKKALCCRRAHEKNQLLFFISEIVDMRTQILAFLCFSRQNSLNNDCILQTFLLQTAAILIRLRNIAID